MERIIRNNLAGSKRRVMMDAREHRWPASSLIQSG
jgi:hypothetical protein